MYMRLQGNKRRHTVRVALKKVQDEIVTYV